jgi:hypothetical protein
VPSCSACVTVAGAVADQVAHPALPRPDHEQRRQVGDLFCRLEEVQKHRFAAHLVQNLLFFGVHPCSLPGGKQHYSQSHGNDPFFAYCNASKRVSLNAAGDLHPAMKMSKANLFSRPCSSINCNLRPFGDQPLLSSIGACFFGTTE